MMKYVRAISLEKGIQNGNFVCLNSKKNHNVLLCDINSGYGSGFLFQILLSLANLTVFIRRDINAGLKEEYQAHSSTWLTFTTLMSTLLTWWKGSDWTWKLDEEWIAL